MVSHRVTVRQKGKRNGCQNFSLLSLDTKTNSSGVPEMGRRPVNTHRLGKVIYSFPLPFAEIKSLILVCMLITEW